MKMWCTTGGLLGLFMACFDAQKKKNNISIQHFNKFHGSICFLLFLCVVFEMIDWKYIICFYCFLCVVFIFCVWLLRLLWLLNFHGCRLFG
jgi:energy-coupling factor transporter transmembrane protein EcfT